MIRKLRTKFVIINMAIVSLLLGIILSLTYCFMAARLENQSIRMMQRIAAAPFRESAQLQSDEEMRLPYFAIRLSPDGQQLAAGGGYYDMTSDEVEKLIAQCSRTDRRMGVIPKYHLRYCRVDTPHSQYLVFADISSEQQTLKSLMNICLLIGALGFCGFLGTSILLSSWAIRPVDRAFQAQKQFIADASHELKTPLTVIRTNAQLLETCPENSGIREKGIASILTMSDQMKTLIEQMLTLARSEGSRGDKVHMTLDFSHLAGQTVLPFEPVFFEKGMALKTELQEGIQVTGDPNGLRQILEILLDNAAKYGDPKGKIWVKLEALPRKKCRLTVANEGNHIPKERLESYFERFTSGDPSRNCRGSFGLGLAIARSIARNHRGRLWAESRDGVNAFYLELNTK